MTDRYVFPVLAAQVVDGDTYRLTLDPGFRLTTIQPVRLDGWDCPEKHPSRPERWDGDLETEKDAAARAEAYSRKWFATYLDETPDALVWCRTRKDPDSFGRWLGTIWVYPFDFYLGEELARESLAARWPRRWWQEHLT